jgi:probable HAF family extracellular repeat protein
MKTTSLAIKLFAITIFLSNLTVAQESRAHDASAKEHARPHHYKFIDLGTLGGPHSYESPNGPGSRLLNSAGVVAASADTTAEHPDAPDFCAAPDCLVVHAFRWSHGVMADLGAVDDKYSSAVVSINDRGWSAGRSETGEIDPAFNFPLYHTVLWKGRKMVDIGTLPGGNTSIGMSINNAGQVVAFGNNDVPDPFAIFPSATQMRTFVWQNGQVQDIGTLGGPDSAPSPGCDNQRPGVIVGISYTSFTPNAASGIPTLHPFLWESGTMTDLGNLGGTNSWAQCINNRGQIIGGSTLPGDLVTHAFLWQNGRMQDLGTLGGPLSEAWWINDSGVVAGSADLPTPGLHDAVIWRHGRIFDLGTVPGDPCSRAYGLNSRGQVVGTSTDCHNTLHAFVWQEGGPMMDLNTLIQPGTGYQLTNAIDINDRGEILAKAAPVGFTPNDDADLGPLALLIPCDDEHSGIDDCDYSEVDPDAIASNVTLVPSTAIRISGDEDRPAFRGAPIAMLQRRKSGTVR